MTRNETNADWVMFSASEMIQYRAEIIYLTILDRNKVHGWHQPRRLCRPRADRRVNFGMDNYQDVRNMIPVSSCGDLQQITES
jgi:hypothetical protein